MCCYCRFYSWNASKAARTWYLWEAEERQVNAMSNSSFVSSSSHDRARSLVSALILLGVWGGGRLD